MFARPRQLGRARVPLGLSPKLPISKPLASHFGALLDADETALRAADRCTLAAVRDLVYRYGLVVITGQSAFSPADDLRVARAFNHTPDPPGLSYTGGAAPQHMLPPPLHEIAVIGRFELHDYHGLSASSQGVYEFGQWPDRGRAWHCDGLADTFPPPDLTLMRCIATPRHGGETLFACARRAAELSRSALLPSDPPPELVRMRYRIPAQSRIAAHGIALEWAAEGARTSDLNSLKHELFRGQARGFGSDGCADVPLVIRERVTGARALCATYHVHSAAVLAPDGSGRVERELAFPEAASYLARAYGPGLASELVYSHRWRVGDVALWSNRLVTHSATPPLEPAATRVHHRVRLRAAAEHAPEAWAADVHARYRPR